MPALVRTRRHFLQTLAGAAVAAPFARRAQAQARIAFESVGPSLSVVTGTGTNTMLLSGASDALLVNGGGSPMPVAFLFNTDWHPHNTGSNAMVAQRGGQVIAHEFTKQYLAIDRYVEWQNNAKYTALPAKALPTKTIVKAGSMTFGGQTIEYAPLGQAHTDGDIYVYFRDANVLAVGDVMTVGEYPIADYTSGGWLGGLVTATKTLLDLARPDTRIVPGIGAVQTRADLQAQYDMLSASRDAFVKMMRQGMSADEMLASGVMKKYDARWGDPALFVRTSYRGMWLHVREVGGIV